MQHELLNSPAVTDLIEAGKATGSVSADEVRAAVAEASISPSHHKALLRLLADSGITVEVTASDSRKRVVAATSNRATVTASTKKAPAKKAAAKKSGSAKKTAAKSTTKKTANKTASREPDTNDVDPIEVDPIDGTPIDGTPIDGTPIDGTPIDAATVATVETVGVDEAGKKALPDLPDQETEKDLANDPKLKEDAQKGITHSTTDA